ncbi:CehA/McbA family metallohydrolase [Anatilimnocola floriformis]|uniref:CehA/McbA family metallohydrolase n=1 Tax=Anatilimnocola floriformis TaxID=2948575 RepID=UPI0020C49B00|nr:CehA/McbA family metallohydrolase [Anatilimnocola floriformis]
MRRLMQVLVISVLLARSWAFADELELVKAVDIQPVKSQAKRIVDALKFLGEPLTKSEQEQLDAALAETNATKSLAAIQKVFDARALVGVNINSESRVSVVRGAAKAELNEQGWSVFLIKVHNEAGVTAALRVNSPNAAAMLKTSTGAPKPELKITLNDVSDRWMDLVAYDSQPLTKTLTGLELEYRLIQVYSRDKGKREAKLQFDIGQGTQDLGFRNELAVVFSCEPAVRVRLDVLDDDGKPTTGQFVFKDPQGRIYPARARRLAPDFYFHDQVYRHHGEEVLLPAGSYEAIYTRGPEYRIQKRMIQVPQTQEHSESFRLKRWIKISDLGWVSGDHHVHAAGCKHYEAPTEGVTPEDMMRHILGEDLNVGCVLSWGPCWYYQKQYFEGTINKLSTKDYLMRYDVEVSGFPSSHAGHLCLLRLKEDDYPGTKVIEDWPSWDLPVLKWGKEQGGVVGFSHSGWGLMVPGDQLPNYALPPFDGIGANEYVVDVVHDVCDFISAVDTPIIWELSVWYHTLNCGYTCRISGETDFPCIYGDRVGLGRVYVKMDRPPPLTKEAVKLGLTNPIVAKQQAAQGQLDFDRWVDGIKDGRSYCCDGLSHLLDFKVNNLGVGEVGDNGRKSFLAIKAGEALKISCRAAGLLEDAPREDIRRQPLSSKPYWHIERARIGDSNKVPVELIVNGQVVEKKEIAADGNVSDVTFDCKPERSSWVAVRIFPACHTNPVFVEVDKQPIRASQRSAQWCIDAVAQCWKQKSPKIRDSEKAAAEEAYAVARKAYEKILKESYDDRAK